MDYPKIREWELAVDAADRSPLADLPENPVPGQQHEGEGTDGVRRKWIAVKVMFGNPAARWAYWKPWTDGHAMRNGIGQHPEFEAIADKIFNGDAHNFIGMLATPYVRTVAGGQVSWVLVDPKPVAPPVQYEKEPPLPSRHERYERSKEVYDVETGESTFL